MPDDMDARNSDGTDAHSEKHSPDLVGEELADGAHIWRVYDRVAREEDRERIATWNRGLDNLALFAGLFSAVTTAFIIEARQDTEPDYARLSFLVLNASVAGVPFTEEPFAMDPNVRATYCLWIASLMLSLTAALIAVMGKDWVGMYAWRPVCNPRQWAEIRTYRQACVDRWYMSGVIASAPVLLHISLLLFAAGLVLFVSQDAFSQRLALGFSLIAGGLYLVAVLSAILVPTSPFKSPATQAVRGAVASLWVSVYDWISYPPKRRPITLLRQATLIIGAALSHPSPASILPQNLAQSRMSRGGEFLAFLYRLLSQNPFHLCRSWRNMLPIPMRALRAYMLVFPAFVFGRVRSAMDAYNRLWKYSQTRSWRAAVRLYLQQLELSDRWAVVRSQPTPELLARSLSNLNATTQSPAVLQAIMIALGDISLGRKVAPFVSSDLKSRLRAQSRHNSPTADLVALSRLVLAELHLSDSPRILPWVVARLTQPDTGRAVRSESIVFALVELLAVGTSSNDASNDAGILERHFPDTVTQPRTLEHLLPRVAHVQVFVVLCQRYWDPEGERQCENVLRQLRRLCSMKSPQVEADLAHRFGGAGLIESLVDLHDATASDSFRNGVPDSISTGVCVLIIKALAEMFLSGVQGERPSLVYAFGHSYPPTANAAWEALTASHSLLPQDAYFLLEQALPLSQFTPRRRGKSVDPRVPENKGTFDVCLARTVLRLLSPSRNFSDSLRYYMDGSWFSTLELCARCLYAHLCLRRGPVGDEQQLNLITLLLEQTALARLLRLWGRRCALPRSNTPERYFMHILTTIARRVAALLGSVNVGARATGARLVRLLTLSECTNPDGEPVVWDLGLYMRTARQGAEVSKCRLRRALLALRPLCTARDDLQAVWAKIGLAADADEYHDPFWDCDDFALGTLFSPDESLAGPVEIPDAPRGEFDTLEWLDAAMH